jgi:hypothetical protein
MLKNIFHPLHEFQAYKEVSRQALDFVNNNGSITTKLPSGFDREFLASALANKTVGKPYEADLASLQKV